MPHIFFSSVLATFKKKELKPESIEVKDKNVEKWMEFPESFDVMDENVEKWIEFMEPITID